MALEWVWQSSGCYLYMYKIIKEQVKQRTLYFKRVMVLILSKMDSVVQEIMKYFMVCPVSSWVLTGSTHLLYTKGPPFLPSYHLLYPDRIARISKVIFTQGIQSVLIVYFCLWQFFRFF